MANSVIISDIKERVIDAITKDDTFFYAIDAKECENGGDLIDTHIFTYNKVPGTSTTVTTYITVMVHTRTKNWQKSFITPALEFYVYTHYKHMKMDRKITKDNRCDYLAKLLVDKFNGSSKYGGIGTLSLTINEEGAYSKDFLYRHLIFETLDLNASVCGRR